MRRILLLLLCLIVAVPAARADDGAATTAGPNADSAPLKLPDTPGRSAHLHGTAARSANCPARPPIAEGAPSSIIVELDPDTLWRPRGAEVRFTIRNPGGTVAVTKVRVCYGWSSPDGEYHPHQILIGSPLVRAVTNTTGAVEYGATLPFLSPVPGSDWWGRRLTSTTQYVFTGVFTVPVADMVVEVTPVGGPPVVVAVQVGVTSAIVAWIVVVLVGILVVLVVRGMVRLRHIRGRNLLLQVISTRDGYASLSQFQIVLWTLVVGMSAIYAMTLSGNLISISDGTLILLGIASASALASRIPATGQTAPVVLAPEESQAMPEWSDLVIPDRATREIDVTRLQMLAFTLITAAFVLIKVVVDYEIPTIPTNFLVLMGISNGVYVGGRSLPSQPKNGGTAPAA
jgi:hypothetical protein